MKVYFYLVISIGLMLTFALAGIDGVGTNIRNLIINEDNTIIQPTTQSNLSIDDANYESSLNSSSYNFWQKILIALLAMAALAALNGIQAFGFSIGGDKTRAVLSIFAYVIFGFIASDLWSIVTLLFSYGNGWIQWLVAVLMSAYLVGFGIAVIEFTGGGD